MIHLKEYKILFRSITDTNSEIYNILTKSLKDFISGQLHFTNMEQVNFTDPEIKNEFQYFFNRAVVAGYLIFAVRLEGELLSNSERNKIMSAPLPPAVKLGDLWSKYGQEMGAFLLPPAQALDKYFFDVFEGQLYDIDNQGKELIKSNITLNIRMGLFIAIEQGFPRKSTHKIKAN